MSSNQLLTKENRNKNDKIAIRVEDLSKCFQIYEKPHDRLLQGIFRGRRQYFKEFWALKDVSFEVRRGETLGIIGRNGSGKSTLLQMICGTLAETSGSVEVNGRVAALLELGAGFNIEFTGRDNVYMNASILGLSQEEINEKYDDIVNFADIGEFIEQPVKTYSSGMYARLAFAIAINVDPDVLIIDEALAVGDARFVAKCMRRIKHLKNQGVTIIFVSHDVGSVRTLCERVIWLDKGQMLEQGDVFPVTGRYMEFLFKDEQTLEDILYNDVNTRKENISNEIKALPSEEQAIIITNTEDKGKKIITEVANSSQVMLDSRPVTHWGSNKGIILSASVMDTHGIRMDIHPWGSQINVSIDVCIPSEISRKHLGIAFSIKDLKGTDLIVSTTHDFEVKHLPLEERFRVSFRLINPLVTGKYLLVATVENREHNDIHYYEYFEGAHYFSSLSEARLFGLFQPPIEQIITVRK